MKNIVIILLLFITAACNINKPEPAKAQALAEAILSDIKNENYAGLDKYYTASMNENETLEKKIEKYKSLKEALGGIESYTLSSTSESNEAEQPAITLKYKLKCKNVNAEQIFTIVKDEGEYKIAAQNTTTLKE